MKQDKQCDILLVYADEDLQMAQELLDHMKVFERSYAARFFHEAAFEPGVDIEQAYQAAMHKADIVMLLLSADFMASDSCYARMLHALGLHQQGQTLAFPVLLRDCAWHDTPIAVLPPQPHTEKSINSENWSSADEPYQLIMAALRPMVQSLSGHKQQNPATVPAKPFWQNPKLLGGIAAAALLVFVLVWTLKPSKPVAGQVEVPTGMTDPRDGKTYPTVQIEGKTWMAKNLNFQMDGSVAYADDPSKSEQTGRLYTWEAAIRACPSGWHLPSKAEWMDLVLAVGGTFDETGIIGEQAYKALSPGGGSGFEAQRGGRWDYTTSTYSYWGRYGYYWSSTPDNAALAYMFYFSETRKMIWATDVKEYKISCRCVQD
jgi:uncharacterized protein (TIGR02145 family)